ncbi:MAG: methyl-accepting chemotaxis sensory transducer [Mycobacterium sp.]|jgi:methyl-accepting chemotaxis protein|nr:methyl-accepting chemotaxis sensory transducer [Mycobacterium sp.]MCW2745536.1 methyl-accepting chemotaxis sensory transducer [Mycobacterium sp.]
MDPSRPLARAAGVASWVLLGLVVAAAAFTHQATPAGVPNLLMVVGWAAASAVVAVGLQWVVSAHAAAVRIRAEAPALGVLLLLAALACDTGVVAGYRGVDGPAWLLYLPLVVFAALTVPGLPAVVLGFAAGGGLVLATFLAGHLHVDEAATLLLVLPTFPALAAFASSLAGRVLRLGAEAVAERDALAAHVAELSATLERASAGDLSLEIPEPTDAGASTAALQQLGVSFGTMLGNLRGLVGQIRSGGDQIGASAGELLATAEEHAVSASQQSSAVAETTSTIAELAATAAQIAETAESVARFAGQTLRHAEAGREAVAASVRAMDLLADRVDTITVRAGRLGESSNEIGRIVEVIDDLSEQTNLLALNAAIEAARAGDQGLGFAVVAAEVRKLAERAQRSTGAIAELVRGIQQETNATIVASEEGAKEARSGTELAREVVDALERISGMVDETTTAARDISVATHQQRAASEQVVSAMQQVSDVSRQYALGSRQTASAAAELTDLAGDLRSSIARFQVS